MVSQSIVDFLQQADELELFPSAAVRIREIVENEETSLLDLEQAVALDPLLSAQVVKLANSPFYGMRREVASLSQALFVLGFDTTRDIALALALMSMGNSARPLNRLVWHHSLRTAIVAQALGKATQRSGGEAFLAALVHDLGKFVFLALKEETYAPVLERHLHQPDILVDAEVALFSFDHSAFAAACLERWELPDRLCRAVRHHHDVARLTPNALDSAYQPAALIWLADSIAHGFVDEENQTQTCETLAKSLPARELGLDAKTLAECGQDIDSAVRELGLS